MLPFREQQEHLRIQIHTESCNQYLTHLDQVIDEQISKPDTQALIVKIYNVLQQFRAYPQDVLHERPRQSILPTVKHALFDLFSTVNPEDLKKTKRRKIEPLLQSNANLYISLQKHAVICESKAILKKSDNPPYQILNGFRNHLLAHKSTLLQRRDSGLITFIKSLGVTLAGIFGVGVGGVLTYQGLFGEESTKGGQFLKEVETNENTLFIAV